MAFCFSERLRIGQEIVYSNSLPLHHGKIRCLYKPYGVGITTLIRQRLMIEAAKYQDPKKRMVSLIFDEMAIKDRMCYSRTEDKFYGLKNTSNENYIGKKPHLANKLLCFVIHGFCTKYTIPAAYYFS
jgi:hypothetical protein